MPVLAIASIFSIICYLASGALLIRRFFGHTSDSTKVPTYLLHLALLSHLIAIITATSSVDGEKLSLTFVLLIIAFLIALSMMIANKFIKNLVFLPIVSLSAAIFVGLYFMAPVTTGISASMSSGMVVHISLSMLAFGFLGISCLYALQLSYINYQLKHKKRSLLSDDLPPLLSVEHILLKLMTISVLILAASLVSGFVFVPSMFADGYAHKTVLSTIALGVYSAALLYHYTKGIGSRSAVLVNIIGVSLLALSYFGSRIVQEFLIS